MGKKRVYINVLEYSSALYAVIPELQAEQEAARKTGVGLAIFNTIAHIDCNVKTQLKKNGYEFLDNTRYSAPSLHQLVIYMKNNYNDNVYTKFTALFEQQALESARIDYENRIIRRSRAYHITQTKNKKLDRSSASIPIPMPYRMQHERLEYARPNMLLQNGKRPHQFLLEKRDEHVSKMPKL